MPVDVERSCVFVAAMPLPASACSSSSIAKDSDECAPPGKEDEEEGEVQSAYMGRKSGAGDSLVGLEALEEALPIRRSMSKFYIGKSKSFSCLKEVVTSSGSVKDISKPENAYSRKRKSLLAYSIMYENSNITASAAEVYETGPPKKPASLRLSRSSLVTMASSSSRSSSSFSIEDNDLPEQLHYPRSPDGSENCGPPKSPIPQSGSCTCKTPSATMRPMMDLPGFRSSSSSVCLKDKKMDY